MLQIPKNYKMDISRKLFQNTLVELSFKVRVHNTIKWKNKILEENIVFNRKLVTCQPQILKKAPS